MQQKAKRGLSSNANPQKAVEEVKMQVGENEYKIIIFFASSSYSPDEISKEFSKQFPNTQTVGCSTAGELFEGKLLKNSLVAMAFTEDVLKNASIAVVENLNNIYNIDKAFKIFESDLKINLSEINQDKYVGITLADGLSYKEEALIERINNLSNIFFTGGSAGDDWKMEKTYVYANGKYYNNAAILVLLETTNGFKVLKTQNFKPVGKIFKATKVNEAKRCINKFNNKPAAIFYAEQIDVPVEEIEKHFPNYSIGIMICNEAYIHDPRATDKNHNLKLYSAIPEGAEVQILEATDIIEETKKFVDNEIRSLKNIAAIINFNCGTRCKKLCNENLIEQYEEIFRGLPEIGFCSYGEFYITFNNQSDTILILE